jgi:hypothetical protein
MSTVYRTSLTYRNSTSYSGGTSFHTGYRQHIGYRGTILYRGIIAIQVARPFADTLVGSWTTAPLFSKINEAFADDSTFISSPTLPSGEYCEVRLSSLGDPLSSGSHTVRYRYQRSVSLGLPVSLTVSLLQGVVLLASVTHNNIPFGWTDGFFILPTNVADLITNYSDLRLRFKAN